MKYLFPKGHKINLGRKATKETKLKMSEMRSGEKNINFGKHLPMKTKLKISLSNLGKHCGNKNPNWKGGKRIQGGYISILKPNHPFCDSNGYVMEHRLVMEKSLGRYLLPEEVVHHKNGILADNREDNLELFSAKSEHTKYHHLNGDLNPWGKH